MDMAQEEYVHGHALCALFWLIFAVQQMRLLHRVIHPSCTRLIALLKIVSCFLSLIDWRVFMTSSFFFSIPYSVVSYGRSALLNKIS